jgi:hypothetical protein
MFFIVGFPQTDISQMDGPSAQNVLQNSASEGKRKPNLRRRPQNDVQANARAALAVAIAPAPKARPIQEARFLLYPADGGNHAKTEYVASARLGRDDHLASRLSPMENS